MKLLQKLTVITLLFLSMHNAMQSGISDTISGLIPVIPEDNKLMVYGGAASVALTGILFNVYTELTPPRKYITDCSKLNLIPWIPGITRTVKKHPYAAAGIAASALGTSYALYKNAEALQKLSDTIPELIPEDNKLMVYGGAASVALTGILFNFYTEFLSKKVTDPSKLNFIPWVPGIVRTIKKHPYAAAGIASILSAGYGLYQHPEVLQKLPELPNHQQLVQKIQKLSENHPTLTKYGKQYLFDAIYATGIGVNFAIWNNQIQQQSRKPRLTDIPATTMLPYIFGLYLLASDKTNQTCTIL